ncbi:MAG: hypothetical protein JW929_02535 [Anaerolineales bacterium]|nr:hypothetical protein [Anaerolineales bacterium]
MSTLEKIRFLTVNYSRLQGLKAIPSGLLLFLVVVWSNGQEGPARDLTLPLLWLFAGILLYGFIDWYYRRTYGRVEPSSHAKWVDVLLSTAFSVVGIAAFWADVSLGIPISLFALVFALGLLLDYVRMLRLAGVNNLAIFPVGLLCIAAVALSAFLTLIGEQTLASLGLRDPFFLVYAISGLVIIVYGLAGHLYLVRSMPPAGEASHG